MAPVICPQSILASVHTVKWIWQVGVAQSCDLKRAMRAGHGKWAAAPRAAHVANQDSIGSCLHIDGDSHMGAAWAYDMDFPRALLMVIASVIHVAVRSEAVAPLHGLLSESDFHQNLLACGASIPRDRDKGKNGRQG